MRAAILSTGDELVRGRTQDRNAAEIARALSAEGLTVVSIAVVGDDPDALAEAILRAASVADVVVMSGGLGPTEDDCTRVAAARAAGTRVVRSPELVRWLEERWARRGQDMPVSNLLQADLPEGAEIVPNAYGTAPGFEVRVGEARLLALPGPPREMRGVLADEVLPRIRALRGETTRVVRTRSLETFGEREARVGELLGELMARDARPRIGTTAARGVIRVILHAEGDAAAVDALLDAAVAEVQGRLGRHVFGVDGQTLPEVVAAALVRSGTTISTAESCTGGLVAAALTSQPGVSAIFPGSVVAYANEEKTRLAGVPAALIEEHGAVSEEVARALADGVRERFATDLGIGITGIAGPDGGTEEKPVGLAHLALAAEGHTTHRRLLLPGDRALVRELATKCALDLVRRHLGG